MNQLVSIDVFHVFDADRVRHELLSVIDHATTFQLVCKIEGHSAAEFTRSLPSCGGMCLGRQEQSQPTWRQDCKLDWPSTLSFMAAKFGLQQDKRTGNRE